MRGKILIISLMSAAFCHDLSSAVPVVVVDKSKNTLFLSNYDKTKDEVVLGESFHVTMGKVVGDKVRKGDLKTPEGIYFFTNHLKTPNLQPKFGPQALLTNYPNTVDKFEGRSGDDIMLHGTNEPERLKKDYDSEGCIVSENENISKAINFVDINQSPILVYNELKPEYLKPANGLKEFFQGWLTAWSSKDLDNYISSYSEQFSLNKMDKKKFKEYKHSLNKRYKYIKVSAKDVQFFTHPKYNVIVFNQHYESSAFKLDSLKILYVRLEEGHWRILKETSGKDSDS